MVESRGQTAGVDRAADSPRVTIGVPLYNAAKYLRQALDSLLAQTFTDFEIIISDNGSTDATPDIIQEYIARDPRIRAVRNEVNRGLVWNHLRAESLARGEYFIFGPQDDWFAPTYVEQCVNALDADPELAYVCAETILVDEDGAVIGRDVPRQRFDHRSPSVRFYDMLITRGGINFYGMTRSALRRRIGRWPRVPRGERVVVAELALWGPFRVLEGDHYFRRIHDGQFTVNRRSRRDEMRAVDPERRGRWQTSTPLLIAEYVVAFVLGALRAPLGRRERLLALGRILRWGLGHLPWLAPRDPRWHSNDIVVVDPAALPKDRAHVGY